MKRVVLALALLSILLAISCSYVASASSWQDGVLIVIYKTQYGTGWWVNNDTVVTAAHVVGWTDNVNVTLVKGDWSGSGHVIFVDTQHDIAIIKASSHPRNIFIFPVADSVKELKELYVIGYPFELLELNHGNIALASENPRVAAGFASWYDKNYHLLEFQAETDAGNSGGPVVYANGAVVGLVSFALTGKVGTLYFATDANAIKDALNKAHVQYSTLEPPSGEVLNTESSSDNYNYLSFGFIFWSALISLIVSIIVTIAYVYWGGGGGE